VKRGWLCELVHEKTGEVIRDTFCADAPLSGPDHVAGFAWRATELAEPSEVVRMVSACSNIDHDKRGWYALLSTKERGTERVGRGRTAWEAVCDAHAG